LSGTTETRGAVGVIPDVMRACVYQGDRRLAVERVPVPAPRHGEVLLRVSHCGVCGTDLHFVLDGWGRPRSILGHEYAGEVVAVGDGVSSCAVGDRVVGRPEPGCGACEYCVGGRPALCTGRVDAGLDAFEGAFAEYKRVRADAVARVPRGLSLREAALAEPLAVALHGVSQAAVRAGQSALVSGAGPIGALVIAALRARGVTDVRVSEPWPGRRALAEAIGARAAVPPDALQVPAMPFALVEEPVHHVFECSGRDAAIEAGLAQLRRGGTLVLMGTGLARPRLDAMRVLVNELHVVGAYEHDATGFEEALGLLASGAIPADRLIEPADVALEDVGAAMEGLAAGRAPGKVLVAPGLGRARAAVGR